MKNKTTQTRRGHISDASTTHYKGSEANKSIVSLTIDRKRYINTKRYAELKGITEWYVNKLCRTGKVECVRVGQMWFIRA
jgi:hypothetical protein